MIKLTFSFITRERETCSTEHDFTLLDRIGVIQQIVGPNQDKFYLSFSGGKDSTILHYLLDEALPGNKIPRVFINTGIEYLAIVDFVKKLQKTDDRIVIIAPSKPIKPTLETYGYPFKSKEFSKLTYLYRQQKAKGQLSPYVAAKISDEWKFNGVPKCLKFMFTDEHEFTFNISDQCCYKLKKEPVHQWEKENGKRAPITAMRKAEGGQRTTLSCILKDDKGRVKKFHPLAIVSEEWEDWYIEKRGIELCKLYYPPYNFKRTGCRGCPFSLDLQKQLDVMEEHLPNEKKACEAIWKPVYDEYRRLNYRLKRKEE